MEHRERLARITYLLKELGEHGLNDQAEFGMREEVKMLCERGLPDNSPIRPALYRHLLNLSPPSILVAQYSAFVEELGSRLSSLPPPTINSSTLESKDSSSISAGLSQDKLLQEIEKDVVRTFSDLVWFGTTIEKEIDQEDDVFWSRIQMLEMVEEERARNLADVTPTPNSTAQFPSSSSSEDEESTSPITPTTPTGRKTSFPLSSRPNTRRQQLLRPLFIYASLNPGIGYVQGMNSIIAVFYWIFSSHTSSSLEAEASAFYALSAIQSQIRDLFVRSLDAGSTAPSSSSTPAGLNATCTRFTSLLTWLDPNVSASLAKQQIDPSLYIFRWLTTIFSNDFALPDLVLVWDRIVSLFPSEFESDTQEVLSPILGHLLDLSLAMVLMVRPIVISPYSSFSKIMSTLQNPQIEGASVDRMLSIAWDIRERRLGKTQRPSIVGPAGGAGDWRSRLGAAVTGPTANNLKQRFWAATSSANSSEKLERKLSLHASEYDLDDSVSQADSDTSTSVGPDLFASKGQNSSVRSSTSTLVEKADESESGEDSEDEDLKGGPSLVARYNNWGGWKSSLAKLSSSDAAASLSKTTTNLSLAASASAASISQSASQLSSSDAAARLSKATTNLSIQASLLKERVSTETPERISRIKENVNAVSGRFLASTGSELSSPSSIRRPGSPVAEPFTPPRWGDSPSMSRRPISPAPFGTSESFNSGGPKPLLLSGSARRASSADGTDNLSPPTSKRNSISNWRSPSPSPSNQPKELSSLPELPHQPISPTGGATSNPRVAASAFRSPSTAPTSLGLATLDDRPEHTILGGVARQEDDSRSSNSSGAVPSASGRGWSLSDTPSRPSALNLNFSSPPSSLALTFESPLSNSNTTTTIETIDSPSSATSRTRSAHNSQLSRRSIHLQDDPSSPVDINDPNKPTRQSSTTSTSSRTEGGTPQRSRGVVKKGPLRKRASKRIEDESNTVESPSAAKEVVEEEENTIREVLVKGNRESDVFENRSEVEDILNAYT